MKVIILAAGMGSRLGFQSLPKPLTPLANGSTILGHQLKHLQAFISLDRVMIVVGYHKEMILEAYPELLYAYNPHFASENTSKSLLRALKKADDDVLWLNGDVVFHPTVLQMIAEEGHSCMVVNVGEVGEEEVKYRTDGHGRIVEVSKHVLKPEGEALGINFIRQKHLGVLCESLEKCRQDDYFEKGIEECIKAGMDIRSVVVDANLCTEVDFPADLERANALIDLWKIN